MIVQPSTDFSQDQILAFLQEEPFSLFFHHPSYMKLISELTCSSNCSVVCTENGKIVGYLPLLETPFNSYKVVNSLPFYGSHGGPLGSRDCINLLGEWYIENIVKNPEVVSSTVVESPFSEPLQNSFGEPLDERIGQFLNIRNKTRDEIVSFCHSKTRNMIRKSEKSNFLFEESNDDWKTLYDIHLENMATIGGQSKPEIFFSSLKEYFVPGKDFKIWVAKKDGHVVSALLLFYWKGFVEYFTPVVKREWRDSQVLTGLILHAMAEGAKMGAAIWNWGGTWKTQDGVYHFKSRWGTEDKIYRYHVHLAPQAKSYTKEAVISGLSYFYFAPFSLLKDSNARN